MSKTSKIVLAIVVIGLITAAIVAKWVYHPHIDVKDADGIKVNATELYNSFLKDSAAARIKYVNNIVEVSGEIVKEDSNQQKQQVIFIKTGTEDAYINCTMEENSTAKPPTQITVKGICNGMNAGDSDLGIPGDVILTRCYPAKN